MSKGWYASGGKSRPGAPRSSGRRNGGNPSSGRMFLWFVMLLGVLVAILLLLVNLS